MVEAGSPDLIVESASVSDRILIPGEAFTLRATVRNQGTGPSAATTLRYYRSTDSTISIRDTQVDTDPVRALAPSRTSAESIRLTAPSSEGTYYYGACVVSVAGESNTGNNCSSAVAITVDNGGESDHPGEDALTILRGVCNFITPALPVTLSVTFRANRDLRDVYAWLTLNGTPYWRGYPALPRLSDGYFGGVSLGNIAAGQTKSFTITERIDGHASGPCGVYFSFKEVKD